MTHKCENLGEIYRRDGRRAKAKRKDLSADTRAREMRKFNGNTVGDIRAVLYTYIYLYAV